MILRKSDSALSQHWTIVLIVSGISIALIIVEMRA